MMVDDHMLKSVEFLIIKYLDGIYKVFNYMDIRK